MSGNSTGETPTAVTSVAPTISPASGAQSFPLTVTLTDHGYTSRTSPFPWQYRHLVHHRRFYASSWIGDSAISRKWWHFCFTRSGHSKGSRHVGNSEPANQLSGGLWFCAQRGEERALCQWGGKSTTTTQVIPNIFRTYRSLPRWSCRPVEMCNLLCKYKRGDLLAF